MKIKLEDYATDEVISNWELIQEQMRHYFVTSWGKKRDLDASIIMRLMEIKTEDILEYHQQINYVCLIIGPCHEEYKHLLDIVREYTGFVNRIKSAEEFRPKEYTLKIGTHVEIIQTEESKTATEIIFGWNKEKGWCKSGIIVEFLPKGVCLMNNRMKFAYESVKKI